MREKEKEKNEREEVEERETGRAEMNAETSRSQYHLRLYAAFAATRCYISSSASFLLSTPFRSLACQFFSGFLFLAFPFLVFGTTLHHCAACSCRLRFIIPQLFRIHATPLQFLLCHSLSSLRPSHTTSFLSQHYHAVFCKIYVCRRASDVAAGYLFFQ